MFTVFLFLQRSSSPSSSPRSSPRPSPRPQSRQDHTKQEPFLNAFYNKEQQLFKHEGSPSVNYVIISVIQLFLKLHNTNRVKKVPQVA